ncbi:MAG: hypothetical protein CFE29_02685 [Bradyrhizobiaceae bacterium PARB1]|nr:MAG: hypothetical protein CFE29_02685 [Bradyrhizobiaceae bacterium PARB1]
MLAREFAFVWLTNAHCPFMDYSARAKWQNKEVVSDGGLVTSRKAEHAHRVGAAPMAVMARHDWASI